MVRDLAKNLGKKINFYIEGTSTSVDRDILEKLEAPLTHLIRNAIDHGIESPEERLLKNKNPEGTIILEARQRSGMLIISLKDDGKGINEEMLRKKIVENGYTNQEIANTLNTNELLEFLFLPGFSTSSQVTEISGRGVGLDVVASMVSKVGGTVRIESKEGEGTTFQLQLPLTLSVLRSMLVEINNEIYAFPLSRIDRILKVKTEELKILEDRQYAVVDNENIGIIKANQVFNLPEIPYGNDINNIVVISDRLNRYGLVIDKFIGEKSIVVIPLDKRLGKIPNISAGAILEDGTPLLILDVDDIVRSIDKLLGFERIQRIRISDKVEAKKQKKILVVDDSLTVREVQRRLLENQGYYVELAVDGMDGWNILQKQFLNNDNYDLVITDIDMPRMNGIELVNKMKTDARFKNIPVMIVSYKDREEDKIKGLEAGANYYLTKSSFHDESLLNAVRDLIGDA
jgi:two-component system sensor histidine kinase and response regulator WspE